MKPSIFTIEIVDHGCEFNNNYIKYTTNGIEVEFNNNMLHIKYMDNICDVFILLKNYFKYFKDPIKIETSRNIDDLIDLFLFLNENKSIDIMISNNDFNTINGISIHLD